MTEIASCGGVVRVWATSRGEPCAAQVICFAPVGVLKDVSPSATYPVCGPRVLLSAWGGQRTAPFDGHCRNEIDRTGGSHFMIPSGWGRALILFLLLIAGFSLLGTPALALSPQLSLRELTHEADLVLSGRVDKVFASYGDDGLIYTQAAVVVHRLVSGSLKQDRVIVSIPGGVVKDVGLWVSDAPRFAAGDQVLLFLKGGERAHLLPGFQGAFVIEDGVLVGSGVRLDEVERAVANLSANDAAAQDGVSLAISGAAIAGATSNMGLSLVSDGTKWGGPNPAGELFYVNESGAGCVDAGAAVQAAAMAWNQVPGADFTLDYGGTMSLSAPS